MTQLLYSHPNWQEYQARASWTRKGVCRAGGLENFARVGLYGDHENYGYPHVIDHNLWAGCTNCIFCGVREAQYVG
jgi:hypothetical protein